MTVRRVRVFVSSPSDVEAERNRANVVAERLNGEFEGTARIEILRWEDTFYSAARSFQEAIQVTVNGLAETDIVICILWSRIGSQLDPLVWRREDGSAYESGTVLEYERALALNRENARPDIYLFRKTAPILYRAETAAEEMAQHQRLKSVWSRWTQASHDYNTAGYQSFADPDDFERQLSALLTQWLERHGAVVRGAVWNRASQGSPFRGLAPFEPSHAAVFFGREAAIARATDKLRSASFLLLLGASGAGKSSLLRSGLIPRITRPGVIAGVDLWRAALVTPASDPLSSLAAALCTESCLGAELRKSKVRNPKMLSDLFHAGAESAAAFVRGALDRSAARRAAERRYETRRPARLFIAIDQLEQSFLEAEPAEVERFADILNGLVEQDIASVVVSLRSDAYPAFQQVPAFAALRERGAIQDLLPPGPSELEDIVTKPVAACDPPLAFERDGRGRSLAEVLAADARGGDALPLLQLTLQRLFEAEEERGDGVLRFADYRGMDQAVTSAAEEAFAKLDPAAQAELPALLIALVRDVNQDAVSGAIAPIAMPVAQKRFERGLPARAALVRAFVAQRLLTVGEEGGSVYIRPVHEALLRAWPAAVRIVTENEEAIRLRHALEAMVAEWSRAPADTRRRYLLTSPARLAGAAALVERLGEDLPSDMRSFIGDSLAADAERREAEDRRRTTILAAMAPMTLRTSGLYVLLVVALLAAAVAVRHRDPPFVQTLRLLAFDTYQQIAPLAYDPNLPVRIVDIDEESLTRIGQWPWPRTTMADLLRALADAGATAVAFDLLLAEPDRTSLEEIVKRLPSDRAAPFADTIADTPTNDEVFAAALEDTPSVVGVALTNTTTTSFPPKAGISMAGDDPAGFLRTFGGMGGLLPAFAEAAHGVGAVNWVPDRDQIVRRVHLVYRVGEDFVPALAAEALRVAHGEGSYFLKSSNASGEQAFGAATGLNHVLVGSTEFATGADGSVALRFRASNRDAFIPAWQVLSGEAPPGEIAGRIIFVGTSAPGLGDYRPTPLEPAVPAVEIHAQLIENVLAGHQLRRPDYAAAAEQGVLIVFGTLLAILLVRLSGRAFAFAYPLTVAALVGGGWAAFAYGDILLDPVYPVLALGFFTTVLALFVYWRIESRRTAIRQAFDADAGS